MKLALRSAFVLLLLIAVSAVPVAADDRPGFPEAVSAPSVLECTKELFQPSALSHHNYDRCIAICDAQLVVCTNTCHMGPPSQGHLCFILCTDAWFDCWHGCDPFVLDP